MDVFMMSRNCKRALFSVTLHFLKGNWVRQLVVSACLSTKVQKIRSSVPIPEYLIKVIL